MKYLLLAIMVILIMCANTFLIWCLVVGVAYGELYLEARNLHNRS